MIVKGRHVFLAGIEVLGMKNGYTHLMAYKLGDALKEGEAHSPRSWRVGRQADGPGIMIGTAWANPGKPLKKPEDWNDPEKTGQLKTVYDALRSLGVVGRA